MKRRLLTLLLLFFGGAAASFSQELRRDTLQLSVHFASGSSVIDRDYMDNGRNLDSFRRAISEILSSNGSSVSPIVVRTASSPEGATDVNLQLSKDRANAIKDFIVNEIEGGDRLQLTLVPVGEDWQTLGDLVEKLSGVSWRREALDIIRNTPIWIKDESGVVVDGRKNRLKLLRDGEAWRYLEKNVFQDLRSGGGQVTCVVSREVEMPSSDLPKHGAEIVSEADSDIDKTVADSTGYDAYFEAIDAQTERAQEAYRALERDTLATVPATSEVTPWRLPKKTEKQLVAALRTNFLAVPLANVGLEVPIGESWSVGLDWYYPWISRKGNYDRCFQLLAGDLELRYWLGSARGRLLGHSLGLYAAGGYYDFERNSSGHQGEFANLGVDYLYACPIFKGKMHLEFELGIGGILSPVREYAHEEGESVGILSCGSEKTFIWLGPTRAQISLVLPIRVKR